MIRFVRVIAALLLFAAPALAQEERQTGLVRGRLIQNSSIDPAADVPVTIPYLRMLALTDADGNFSFARVPFGTHTLVIGGSSNAKADTVRIVVNDKLISLNDIKITPNDRTTSIQSIQIPTVALEETDNGSEDDGVKSANVSGLLTASRDPFLSAAAFVFGPYRFQPRGYDRSSQQVLINGAPMNDVETGDAYWSQWGGLNDVFRGRSNTYGLAPNEFAYGGVNGTVYFDAVAANQRKQTRLTYSATNRQYRNRLMLTHSSGMQANGWAYSISGSRRWADEGYIPGTDYNAYSYYLGVSRRIKAHTISFTTFGAPQRRGKSAPSFQEANDLAGTNFYNPNWGYQNGKMRNAKVAQSFQPIFLLNHEWAPDSKTRVNTVLGYQTGRNTNSTLDWYNAPDPRPDYYRYLPSFYSQNSRNPADAEFNSVKQIQWDNLIQTNYANLERNFDGQLQRRSLYVVGRDVDEIKKWIFNTNLERVLSDHVTATGGLSAIIQRTESYRELEDLLGGDFYRNLNQFAGFNNSGLVGATENNLNNANDNIHVGDRYYYNYINRFNRVMGWGQVQATYNKVDLFAAAHIGYNSFDREGLYRNGLFAADGESFGRSGKQTFLLYGVKGGVTYKYNGRHYFFLNAGIQSDAPSVDNTFISPRTRNYTVPGVTEQVSYTAEGGYLHRAPKTNIRVVGFATDVKNATEVKRFFAEQVGGASNTFINYAMSGIAMRFIGTELAVDYKVSPAISLTGVVALHQAFYTNNPTVRIYRDNFADTTRSGGFTGGDEVYIKNYYVAGGPQSAYTAGVNYRSKRYWYLNVNGSFFDRNYIDIAAPRRTERNVAGLVYGSDAWKQALAQEKFASAFTVDVFGGKSFLLNKINKKIPRSVFLYLNAGISNLLDNQNIRTGGFENLRTDDAGNLALFQPKYFYAFGRNYFVNLSLKF